MKARDRLILMAAVGKPQGLGGQVRLKFYGDNAAGLRRFARFYTADGRVFAVQKLELRGSAPIAALAGVKSREAAEALAGTELYVRRDELAEPAGEDEFYQDDLLGFAAFAEDGAPLGAVSGFFNFGGGDLLELTLPPRAEAEAAKAQSGAGSAPPPAKLLRRRKNKQQPRKELIPFSKAAVPLADIAARRIIINRRAAGLLPAEISAEKTAALAAEAAAGEEEQA